MNQEEKRIAIAKACGWKDIKCYGSYWTGTRPRQPMEDDDQYIMALPRYFDDLNAMHDAEKILKYRGLWDGMDGYVNTLCGFIDNADTTHATATQRAEAFGLTLELW